MAITLMISFVKVTIWFFFSSSLLVFSDFFLKKNKSIDCSESCLTCYGGNDNECLSCPNGELLESGSCLSNCSDGNYLDDLICQGLIFHWTEFSFEIIFF